LADGSFMALMKTHRVSKHLFPLTQWKTKRYFELSNDQLGSELPMKNKAFRFDLTAQ
jgi:hypothetical protein